MMPPTGANKARAWLLAAQELQTVARSKLSTDLSEADRRVWNHVVVVVVASLKRRADIIKSNAREAR